MKIDLTRKEYRDLLDILFIADWVLNAQKVDDDPRTARYNKLEQKFLHLAQQMGYENLVECDPENGPCFPTSEFEDTSAAYTFIDEYDDGVFWHELIDRMAERDLAKQLGGYERIGKLTREEMVRRLGDLLDYYGDEFMRNGLDNLQLRGQRWSGRPGRKVH